MRLNGDRINKLKNLLLMYQRNILENKNDKSANNKYSTIHIKDLFKNAASITDNISNDNIPEDKAINIDINDDYVDYEKLSDYNPSGNMLLYYIMNELDTLINNNDNNKNKILLLDLIIKITDDFFNYNSDEPINNNINLILFNYKIAIINDLDKKIM